jgi:hypothetical protein
VFSYSVKSSSSKSSIKLESGVSPFLSDSKIEIVEGCGGFGKDSGSVVWDYSSKGFSSGGSLSLSARIWSKIFLAFGAERCKNDPLKATLRNLEVFFLRPI